MTRLNGWRQVPQDTLTDYSPDPLVCQHGGCIDRRLLQEHDRRDARAALLRCWRARRYLLASRLVALLGVGAMATMTLGLSAWWGVGALGCAAALGMSVPIQTWLDEWERVLDQAAGAA